MIRTIWGLWELANLWANYPEYQKGTYLYGDFGVESYMVGSFGSWSIRKRQASTTLLHLKFLGRCQNAISSGLVKETVDQVKKAEILILDDIGANRWSAWVRDEIYRWFCSTDAGKSLNLLYLTLILKNWNVILRLRKEMKPGRPNAMERVKFF